MPLILPKETLSILSLQMKQTARDTYLKIVWTDLLSIKHSGMDPNIMSEELKELF